MNMKKIAVQCLYYIEWEKNNVKHITQKYVLV